MVLPTKNLPKSIYKNPEAIDTKQKHKKHVRFMEEGNKYVFAILTFTALFTALLIVFYMYYKDTFNTEDYKIYIRQILDYISLVTQKIKLLIYKTE